MTEQPHTTPASLQDDEISLLDLLLVVVDNLRLLLLGPLLGGLLAYAISFLVPPTFESVAIVKGTFGRWVGERLSADNKKQLWVPPGFAHGFVVLSESAEFLYKTTDYWYPEHERSLLWNDPAIGIDWPLEGQPLLAAKDAAGVLLAEAEHFE